jgi:PAS domain S-box-containing protein
MKKKPESDITPANERKCKELLEASEEKYRTLYEYSPDAIMITAQDGTIYSANPAACNMLGYSEYELCSDGRNGIVDNTPQLFEALEQRRKTGKYFGELTFVKKDGTRFPVEISSSVLTNSDGRELTTMVIRDITERKAIENAFIQAHDWQEAIFEGSIDAIFISDTDAFLIAVNKAACDLTGYSKEELLKMRIPDLHDELDLEAFKKYHKKIFNGEKILSEAKILRRDGVKVDTEFNNSRISISGRFYMHTTARDVTGRKKSERERKCIEEKIVSSEAEYRGLFENSIMGISQTYPSGGYKRINRAYAIMYGYPDIETMLTEVSGNTTRLFPNPDHRKKVIETLEKEGYMPPTEFELIKRNGEKFWALVAAKQVKDDRGELLYLQAEHIDITSRKKLEQEMYSASIYARNLIEASLDPLVTISAAGKITDVNLATEKITGITRDNLIGSDFADYFENPVKAKSGYKTVFSEGIVKDYPLTIVHKSGRKRDVLYNASLFKNENSEVQGVFAAARDITTVKKIEEELRKSKKLLEKLNQHLIEVRENERNEIALNLHDDLGQKLTAINLDIAWLKSRIGVQSKAVREKIEEMSGMIKETIENIKETSALLRPAMLFDLGLVPAIKSQLGSFEKQTGIKCNICFRPEEILLEDRLSLIVYRILQESMTNIARHSGALKADINLSLLKNNIELIIKDDGCGIEKNKVNSFRSMGIAGIKERVKSVDGKITIVGEPGSGTVINVEIPLPKVKTND